MSHNSSFPLSSSGQNFVSIFYVFHACFMNLIIIGEFLDDLADAYLLGPHIYCLVRLVYLLGKVLRTSWIGKIVGLRDGRK
jgi:hypothetical protein